MISDGKFSDFLLYQQFVQKAIKFSQISSERNMNGIEFFQQKMQFFCSKPSGFVTVCFDAPEDFCVLT